jgi:hypothetical protein
VGGFRSNVNFAFGKQPTSAITAGTLNPVISIAGTSANPIVVSNIVIAGCSAACIQVGTSPTFGATSVTLDRINVSSNSTSTVAPLFIEGAGFGVFSHDSVAISNSSAPAVDICGVGQVYLDNFHVSNHGVKIECGANFGGAAVSTLHFQHMLSEAIADPALFSFDLSTAAGSYSITLGPQIHMADNVSGAGLYLLRRTDTASVALNIQLLGGLDGWATQMTSGLRVGDAISGFGSEQAVNFVAGQPTQGVLFRGFLVAPGDRHSFGRASGTTNTTLTVNQVNTGNPGVIFQNMSGGAQGDLFQTQYSNGNPRFAVYDTTDIGGGAGWKLYNNAATFSALFTVTPTANRQWTFQDASDTVVGRATTDSLTNKDLKLRDQGQCTMAAGACAAQTLAHTYAVAPACIATWTGTGTLTGIIKIASTTTTVTPSSSVGTDTAQVNWVCFGN